MPSYSVKVDPKSKLHEKIIARLTSRWTVASAAQMERHDKWRRAEETVLAYVPTSDADSVRKAARDQGKPKYTTIMLPYTYALLMTAHTYWTSVFFARSPVHQYSGRHGEAEQQIQAVEALIAYQVEVGEMMGPYYIWLYDAGKYGIGVLGHYWTVERIAYGSIVEMPNEMGQPTIYQATQEVEGYRGNRSYNISPYDFYPDPRVPITRFQSGEFCFIRKRMGWSDILARKREGYFINIDEVKDHLSSDKGVNDGATDLKRPDFARLQFDDMDAEGTKSSHPAGATFLEVYIELIPNEWGLGNSDRPQKWCITVTDDLALVVGASPLGYIHGRFPVDILEPEVEGYGLYNRGIPEIMEPLQQTMDWLINSHFFNVRSALNNQFIIDPSKIVIKDAQNSDAGFIWRLRPEAYGSDITKMFHQVQVQDVTRGHLGDVQSMMQFGERVTGVNDQIMGVLAGGGRKTATEVRTSTGFGVNRQKTVTEYMSAHGFSQHSQKLVQSSQQFYDQTAKMKIVGDLALDAGPRFMDVTPEMIAGFYNFVPVDGTLPVDRMAQANLWKEIFGGLQRMPPQIQMGYDWSKMFAWMATLAGLKNIHQMKVKVVPDGVAQAQAAAGNVVPLPGRMGPTPALPKPGLVQPGNSASNDAGLNTLEGADYANG